MIEVAVYCASASDLDEVYRQEARTLGQGLAKQGLALVYGGGNVGLMGDIAAAVHAHSGYVIGYIPERLMAIEGRAYDVADELFVTKTMQERKRSIFERADAFVVLPGGMGTLEEFMEVATLRKLGYHDKPIFLINKNGFWDHLISFLRYSQETGFSPPLEDLYHVVPDAAQALDLLCQEIRPQDALPDTSRTERLSNPSDT